MENQSYCPPFWETAIIVKMKMVVMMMMMTMTMIEMMTVMVMVMVSPPVERGTLVSEASSRHLTLRNPPAVVTMVKEITNMTIIVNATMFIMIKLFE